ncbi:uncharacterized protein V2V93DRAFT_221764 [Kockiozyma suomiensis]|uniref:uncharacterized protein n=1 Tax=Kockiozyma suomiensis TaxID=1337062 RepID=UPI0033437765
MFIPYGDIKRAMYESLAKRDVFDDANNDAHKVISFGQSFKHWDTCMANTGCKVIAIIGIILAVCLVLSLFAWVIRLVFYGAEATCWLCCKCCGLCMPKRSDPRGRASQAPDNLYTIPNQQPYYTGPPAPPNHGRKSYAHLNDEPIEMGRMARKY